jgi:putative protease
MNSKDLRAIQHVERLARIGIDSLKIEGRTKSHYYVARTAQIYRQAIDDAMAGRPFNPELYGKLNNLANRGYTEGFYQRHPDQDYQNYLENNSVHTQQKFVGEIINFDPTQGLAEVEVKNKLSVGDKIEIIAPHGNIDITLEQMQSLKGEPMEVAPGAGYQVRIPLPGADYSLGLLARYL